MRRAAGVALALVLVAALARVALDGGSSSGADRPRAATAAARRAAADGGARVVAQRRVAANIVDLTVRSPALGETATVRLVTPIGWAQRSSGRRWPVLYLLHGCCDTPESWTANTDVARHPGAAPRARRDAERRAVRLVLGLVERRQGRGPRVGDVPSDGAAAAPRARLRGRTTARDRGPLDGRRRRAHLRRAAPRHVRRGGVVQRRRPSARRSPGLPRRPRARSAWPIPRRCGAIRARSVPSGRRTIPSRSRRACAARRSSSPSATAPRVRSTTAACRTAASRRRSIRRTWRSPSALQRLHIPATIDFYGPGTHSWPYWQRELHRALPILLRALGGPTRAAAA